MRARRRLVLFAYYYPPLGGAGSQRALSFARHLPDEGFDVTVVAPRTGVYGRDPSLAETSPPGVEVLRTGTLEPAVLLRRLRKRTHATGGEFVEEANLNPAGRRLRGLVRRVAYFPDSSAGWIRFAVRTANQRHARAPFDIALSTSPPVSAHVAALRFARAAGIPWASDWRDLWTPRLPGDAGTNRRRARLESDLIEASDGLSATSDQSLEFLRERTSRSTPAQTVRNGFELEEFSGPPPPIHRPPQVLYTGTVCGRQQDLRTFFAGLAMSRTQLGAATPSVRFLGKVDAYTRSLPAELGSSDLVRFEGFLSHASAVRALRRAAGLFVAGWSGAGDGDLVPAKTYEYLASGRPILCVARPDSEVSALLADVERATVVPFGDALGVSRWLSHVVSEPKPSAPADASTAVYARARQARAMASLLEATLDSSPDPEG